MTDKKYFCGKEISAYGVENNRVDYRTLASCFDAVLNNEIIGMTSDIGYWEQVNGFIDNSDEIESKENRINDLQGVKEYLEEKQEKYNNADAMYNLLAKLIDHADDKQNELQNDISELEDEQEYQPEIFQYYIISDAGAELLEEYTNEIIFYNEKLDMYVWGVTHYGTSWDYVLTDIKISDFENRYK